MGKKPESLNEAMLNASRELHNLVNECKKVIEPTMIKIINYLSKKLKSGVKTK